LVVRFADLAAVLFAPDFAALAIIGYSPVTMGSTVPPNTGLIY
jgi:hypothetical protein